MNFYCFQYCVRMPLALLISAILSLVILATLHFECLSPVSSKNWPSYDIDQPQAENIYDQAHVRMSDLLARIHDLKRIKLSMSNELRTIEREKARLIRDKTNLVAKNEKLIYQINKSKSQLRQLELDISAKRKRKFEQACDGSTVSPILFNPFKSIDIEQVSIIGRAEVGPHHNEFSVTGLDHSKCSLSKEFKFHLLEPPIGNQDDFNAFEDKFRFDPTASRDILRNHRHYTSNVSDACLLISVLDTNMSLALYPEANHLVINLFHDDTIVELPKHAAKASSSFKSTSFRDRFDVILPATWQLPTDYNSIIGSIPSQSPIERKYLACYFGRNSSGSNSDFGLPEHSDLNPLEETLRAIHRNSIDDLFFFAYRCSLPRISCHEEREKMMELSTFLIILPGPENIDAHTYELVYLALARGTVPVIVGKEKTRLPFDEVLDWRRASLSLHTSRLPEIHFILRTISTTDIYTLKYQGKRIFENYLATAKQIIDTTIAILSLERFNYPPPPIQDIKTITYYSSAELVIDKNCSSDACLDAQADSSSSLIATEILGPREKPLASPSFRRNFSLVLNSAYDLWNSPMHSPMHSFPSMPTDPVAPSEFKFFAPDQGYRPIGDGLGGSGQEFSRAIGGDYLNEQFTIVLLTYERKSLLMKTLMRLKGLPYLNKILVIWNGVNHKPPPDLVWPDVEVPIKLVEVARNSLNNRFLPYDEIETDGILSLDDDSPLRQDEIVFAFRVWRQSRDRIVGFPGRFHAWDHEQSSWLYNSNHSCELSMVLTGGAFFHKYYTYMYTYNMPEAIRSIVDEFMNCEDIAMNFLVAHLTRKPPIKVTSRWTFHCAGCPSSLSEDDSHFRERHECLNTFASIYGYMPLLVTQHRSDSVLFKTRLPQDKQKCFKYV